MIPSMMWHQKLHLFLHHKVLQFSDNPSTDDSVHDVPSEASLVPTHHNVLQFSDNPSTDDSVHDVPSEASLVPTPQSSSVQ